MRTVSFSVSVALAAFALNCVTASAQAASGLEPGVHVDPGSPVAKEYALPLNQARDLGSTTSPQPSSTSTPQTSAEGAPFGAGIKPPGSGGPPRGSKGTGKSPGTPGTHSSAGGAGGGSGSQPQLTQAVLRAARDESSSGGNGSTLALLGGAVAILVLGGFGGTVLRHSRRPT